MIRSSGVLRICALPALAMLSACSAQMSSGSDRRYEDLRGLVIEQRRAIDELRKEQESLRASLDQLQYGRRPGARPVYGPAGGAGNDSYWRQSVPPPPVEPEYPVTSPGEVASVPPLSSDPRFSTQQPAEAAVPAPAGASPAAAPADSGGVPSELVGSSYDSAMRQLSSGDHDDAIQSFRNYLHENASSAYADDAQFWIGEAYFRKGQYHRAIIELNQVAINYGSGDRAPAALLRQAEAFRIVGDRVDARLSLQKIINHYPGTQEAAKASRMLNEIGG